MHITEGIITGSAAIGYTALGASLVAWGTTRMTSFVKHGPENKPLLGMGAAIIFFISLIPIPAFTGTCSHPCGTPLIGILLGPVIGCALTGVSLLMQAAFFAHGGFGTWGANVVALGFFGCFFGWAAFRLARLMGLPIWAAGLAGGLIGDVMVYLASGLILATTLSQAPDPQYSLTGYLLVIYTAYVPTQMPIAIGEMVVTGLALHYAYKQRPDVLETLGVIRKPTLNSRGFKNMALFLILLTGWLLIPDRPAAIAGEQSQVTAPTMSKRVTSTVQTGPSFTGMDEAVNETLAEAAGRPAREPYIDTEAMGDLWNLLLLSAGGVCGFVVGRWWHLLWGRPPKTENLPLTSAKS